MICCGWPSWDSPTNTFIRYVVATAVTSSVSWLFALVCLCCSKEGLAHIQEMCRNLLVFPLYLEATYHYWTCADGRVFHCCSWWDYRQKIDQEIYHMVVAQLQQHVVAKNSKTSLETSSADGKTLVPVSEMGRITCDMEFRFMLHRHWSLYEVSAILDGVITPDPRKSRDFSPTIWLVWCPLRSISPHLVFAFFARNGLKSRR